MAREQQEQPENPAETLPATRKHRGQGRASVETVRVRRWVRIPKKKLTPAQQARVIQTKERMAKALELRKASANYKQIGEALGISESYARRLTIKAMNEVVIDDAKEVIAMDLLRLDELQMRATQAFRQGDLRMIQTIMQIMRERRDILGLTTESWKEQQAERAGNFTNNGIMVVQGSSENFVRSMMQAVGVDPNSPEAQQRLAAVRAQEEAEGRGEFALTSGPRPNDLLMQAAADNALNRNEKTIPGVLVRSDLQEEDI